MNSKVKMFLPAGMIMMSCLVAQSAEPAVVHISNSSGNSLYFQPTADMYYTKVSCKDTVLNIVGPDVFYTLMDADGNFYPVYVTRGSETEIAATADGIDIKGTNGKENRFMLDNKYLCHAPAEITTYSGEWVDYQKNEIKRLDDAIDAAGLDSEFAELQKLANRYVFYNQMLGGVTTSKAFGRKGEKMEISEDFYSFLNDLNFDNEKILLVPRWFDVVSKAIEMKEAKGLIPVTNDDYMNVYASQVIEERLRSHFIISLLNKTLKYNYLPDFERQLPRVRGMITDPDALAALPALEEEYETRKKEAACAAPGVEMPDFLCKDVDGKGYRLSDMRGNYVLIDFWFTGCVPCRAEMPYFDKVAEDFDGKGVKFISLSVDTGEDLYPRWEKMMRTKSHAPGVLSVNLPDGFNSPLLKQLNIKGVPRIMLISPDGKIVEGYAKRPSDPKLRQQLESLTK